MTNFVPATAALFEPMTIGARTARNRIVMAPLSACYADGEGFVTQAQREHYGRRAQGGAGIVITENFAISPSGRQLPRQGCVSEERYKAGLTGLAEEIKRHGALAILQIVHAGRYAGPWDQYDARPRLAPSAIPFPLTPGRIETPAEIAEAEIVETIADFGRAAALAEAAGFDGVEVHGGQGFLISQFVSPRINQRTDRWGGSYEGRAAFPLEVLRSVRAAVSPEFIVGWHLFSEELMPGGTSVDEAMRLAVDLEQAGADFLLPVAGTFEAFQQPENRGFMGRPLFQTEAARRIAGQVSIPVFVNGRLGSPEDAAALVASGPFAAIALGRPLLTDPDWPTKVQAGDATSIHTCACDPPTCIQTQLGGVRCHSWPEYALEQGFLGYAPSSQQ